MKSWSKSKRSSLTGESINRFPQSIALFRYKFCLFEDVLPYLTYISVNTFAILKLELYLKLELLL